VRAVFYVQWRGMKLGPFSSEEAARLVLQELAQQQKELNYGKA
jgi:hypothetical protein